MSNFNFDQLYRLIETWGYLGVFVGTFLEGVFPPIPSELVLGFAGFLVGQGTLNPFFTLVAAMAGNVASVSIMWFVGHSFGRHTLLKWGAYIGFKQSDLDKGESLFNQYGYWSVFFLQVVPLARTLIAIPAGTFKTSYVRFILANSLGAALWMSFLIYLGTVFGSNWKNISAYVSQAEKPIILTFLIVCLLATVAYVLYSRSAKKPDHPTE